MVALALFSAQSRAGQNLVDTDFIDDQLKRNDQSLSRVKWTSGAAFHRYVVVTRAGQVRPVSGIASARVIKLRELRFKVPNSNPVMSGAALCVIDRVEAGDHDGHAALGYAADMQALTPNQKKKTRPLVRAEAARQFSTIVDSTLFSWEPPLALLMRQVWWELRKWLYPRRSSP